MPEPLKHLFNAPFIDRLSAALVEQYPSFDTTAFKSALFDDLWPERELKDRISHIAACMQPLLPEHYGAAVEILCRAGNAFSGIEHLVFPAYVEQFGLDEYEASIRALEIMTPCSSSELAVRPFIIRYGEKMMQQMQRWSDSENEHVRRLASEGCRPRLPWAMALPAFKKDPAPVLRIIEPLMRDDSEYVRRSVANNLNDISKDHPDRLTELLQDRLGESPDSDWILKHASRTLLKQGNPEVLHLFGFSDPEHITVSQLQSDSSVAIGQSLAFSFSLHTTDEKLGRLRIEYAIDFMKANGKQSRKIFKISEADYRHQTKTVHRNHSLKRITTRRYYPGRHDLAIIINGQQLASIPFTVTQT